LTAHIKTISGYSVFSKNILTRKPPAPTLPPQTSFLLWMHNLAI